MDKSGEFSRLLALFDFYWHRHQILNPSTPPPPKPSPSPQPRRLNSVLPRHLLRSLSDEPSTSLLSAPDLLRRPKLATVVSGQESTLEELAADGAGAAAGKNSDRFFRRRRRQVKSKSLSDLEFEELKGIQDLGFTFSDSGADPRLMEIVPALQRLAKLAPTTTEIAGAGEDAGAGEGLEVRRPYLSEAWGDQGVEELLRNWRVPAIAGAGGERLKDHIKFWARAVASTVR